VSSIVTSPDGGAEARRAGSVRLVPFLFGVAGRDELSGVALVQLLGALGLSASAARGLIARMRREGQLAAAVAGRGRRYRLAGNFAEAFRRIRDGAAGQPAPWDGVFHALLYRVPETERAFRDRLRRQAVFAGYGTLHQGVLICPADRREYIRSTLNGVPDGAVVYFGRLELAAPEAARAASEAWDLDQLNHRYRSHADRLRSAAPQGSASPPATGETLRIFTDLLSPALVDLLRSPPLPAELFPPDWSIPELRDAIGAVQQRFGPPSAAFVRRVLDSA
jgi:phenylacetic acid degradation operon negative regulatory protein